jgi:hypothetical protein
MFLKRLIKQDFRMSSISAGCLRDNSGILQAGIEQVRAKGGGLRAEGKEQRAEGKEQREEGLELEAGMNTDKYLSKLST